MAVLFIDHGVVGGMGSLGIILRDYAQRIVTLPEKALATKGGVSLEDIHGVVVGDADCAVRLTEESHRTSMKIVVMAHEQGIPMIGLGFGGLVVAKALGSVIEDLNPPEVGWTNMTSSPMARGDALLTGVPWTFAVPVWSRQSIGSAANGMQSLAATARQKFAMFACGVSTYGITVHLEWGSEAADAAVRTAGGDLAFDKDAAAGWRNGSLKSGATSARIAKKIFESVTLSLMPVDRINAGVARDLHH